MFALTLAILALIFSAIPALLFLANLRLYRPAPNASDSEPIYVSLLIPARNEESTIVEAVEAALASRGITLEVIVLDDHSEDRTAELVRQLAQRDPRVRLEQAPPLPAGWCGKQHACFVLARSARYPLLAFIDADVRLAPDALARLATFLKSSNADLVSGFPHQRTGSFFEALLIPLIHFVLLGFLPFARMRASTHPAYAAGCGQLFLTKRDVYDAVGGHAMIRSTLHDGIKLPRLYRTHSRKTDLCDATDLASCRMYQGAIQTWKGLAKNATEGLAAPGIIVPMTLLLLTGQVLPFALLTISSSLPWNAFLLTILVVFLVYLPRLLGVVRFRQSLIGALLHPVGIVVLLAIQWYALGKKLLGRPSSWRGRAYRPESV